MLVIAAHGTRWLAGQRVFAELTSRLAHATGDEVRVGWIDVLAPTLAEVIDGAARPVVLPWLVGGGYHLVEDVHRVVADTNPSALVTGPLGDSSALTHALIDRLAGLGGGPVALLWAGSSTSAATRRVTRIAARVALASGRPVTPVPMTAAEESPQEAMARLRCEHGEAPVGLALLLAPGFFHDRAMSLAARVSPPLGTHPALLAWAARRGMRPRLADGRSLSR